MTVSSDKRVERFVLERVAELTISGMGSRFPTPLAVMVDGQSTPLAMTIADRARIDTSAGGSRWVYDVENEIMRAVRQLHHDGRVVFVWRYGYTWIVPAGHTLRESDEVTDGPQQVNRPWYWSKLVVREGDPC